MATEKAGGGGLDGDEVDNGDRDKGEEEGGRGGEVGVASAVIAQGQGLVSCERNVRVVKSKRRMSR